MNIDELAALNDQIAAMARAGLPMDQGLESLSRDMGRGRLRSVTKALANDMRAGATLPEALDRRKLDLPPFYSSLATAGLRTGRLPEVLLTLTTYARTISSTRAVIIDVLLYPAIVIFISAAMIGLMSYYVLPQFDNIYRDFRVALPPVTEWILAIGRAPVRWVVGPMVGIVVVALLTRFIVQFTEGGRRAWARTLYSVPLVGTLFRMSRLAAFVDLLAVMIEHEVPLPEAMKLAGNASSDPLLSSQSKTVAERLEHGDPLGVALRGQGLLPEWVAWMTLAGECRGSLAGTLKQIGTVYRRQVESRAALLRNILPSILIIGTALLLAGAFIFAVVLPAIKLLEGLSK